jgi:exodeoxyribonuclease VII small subunit
MKMTFEKKLEKLEQIIAQLEDPSLELEQSAKLFEEGLSLSKELSAQLSEVKNKVELLKKQGSELKLETFEEEK